MKLHHKIGLVTLVSGLCISIDQVTKALARRYLMGRPTLYLGGDLIRLLYSENRGAFLSLGAELSDEMRFWTFVVSVGLGLLGLCVWSLTTSEMTWQGLVGVGFVLGGGGSNWLDRVRYEGHVVDFMNIGIGPVRTGIFNVADVMILVGMGLLLLWITAAEHTHKSEDAESPQT